ncbi:MAG: ureidoglycolate lyase [Alphaproteobacteria bacterium]|nr:ureidoglycolate lyase [Alphaproteobacteria bacterium]
MTEIRPRNLTREGFAPFGDVIEIDEVVANQPINGGSTQRFDLATATISGTNAQVQISMARAKPFSLPYELKMVERHPHGSQAFVPVRPARFLVVVAPDENGKPGMPQAFLAGPGQGINYHQGTWHGVLTALDAETDFIIVDRKGDEPNCDTVTFDTPFSVLA